MSSFFSFHVCFHPFAIPPSGLCEVSGCFVHTNDTYVPPEWISYRKRYFSNSTWDRVFFALQTNHSQTGISIQNVERHDGMIIFVLSRKGPFKIGIIMVMIYQSEHL